MSARSLEAAALILCWFGWHGKSVDRVLKEYPTGAKILAEHCSRCGKCYVEITPEMRRMLDK